MLSIFKSIEFPSRGPKRDADAAKLFVQKMFVGASGKKNIYPFSTCATGIVTLSVFIITKRVT